MIFKAFFNGKYKVYAWTMMTALIASIWYEAWLISEINGFYGPFWDAVQDYNRDAAFALLFPQKFYYDATLSWIAAMLVINGTLLGYFSNKWMFWWRQSIVEEYIPKWLEANDKNEGAAQRIQEDTYKFAKFVRLLGREGIKSILILWLFIPILIGLSGQYWDEYYLLIIAIATSLGGMLISYVVAIRLPGLEYKNQVVEAKFRKQLVLLEDDKEAFTNETLMDSFAKIRFNYFRLFNNYAAFQLWSRIYWQGMVFVPLLTVLPMYFVAQFKIGLIHQITNAFDKVNESASYMIDNWTLVTELISVNRRLSEFEKDIYESK